MEGRWFESTQVLKFSSHMDTKIKISAVPTKYLYCKVNSNYFDLFSLIRIDPSLKEKIMNLRGQLDSLEVSEISLPDHTPCILRGEKEELLLGRKVDAAYCWLNKFDVDDYASILVNTTSSLIISKNGFKWKGYDEKFGLWVTTMIDFSDI